MRLKKKLSWSATFLALSLLAALGAGGCSTVGYVMYLFMPEGKMETVEPEFAGLAGNTVAIIIYAEDAVLYDYPLVRLTLPPAASAG